MLRYADQLPDIVDAAVRTALTHLQENCGPRRRPHELYHDLVQLLGAAGYQYFSGDCRHYHLRHRGDRCLYDVPLNQRGFLQRFRGQRIRLICAGAWDSFSGRGYFAAAVARPARVLPARTRLPGAAPA